MGGVQQTCSQGGLLLRGGQVSSAKQLGSAEGAILMGDDGDEVGNSQ